MSYILDALRKSESERQQGRIPDLGQQVQLIHKPRRRGIPVMFWVGLALVLNAIVLAVIFWPGVVGLAGAPVDNAGNETPPAASTTPAGPASPDAPAGKSSEQQAAGEPVELLAAPPEVLPALDPDAGVRPKVPEQPTVIVPSWKSPSQPGQSPPSLYTDPPQTPLSAQPIERAASARVPHLVELPMSFQKRIPTLIFNSHIYASDPGARRVMINDNYLRTGQSFSGIRVDDITVDGVVLSLDGQQFRVGVVRDWISPR
ncbi:general secretion pathway protein GspB [Marinobacter sp.]|uniref:general secretion pathway protein GspB n=1 Tax=Marinobacter sp. TaxID=50741 RepID=UPI00384A6B67